MSLLLCHLKDTKPLAGSWSVTRFKAKAADMRGGALVLVSRPRSLTASSQARGSKDPSSDLTPAFSFCINCQECELSFKMLTSGWVSSHRCWENDELPVRKDRDSVPCYRMEGQGPGTRRQIAEPVVTDGEWGPVGWGSQMGKLPP